MMAERGRVAPMMTEWRLPLPRCETDEKRRRETNDGHLRQGWRETGCVCGGGGGDMTPCE